MPGAPAWPTADERGLYLYTDLDADIPLVTSTATLPVTYAGSATIELAVADFDENGLDDVAATHAQQDLAFVWLTTSPGLLGAPATLPTLDAPRGLVAASLGPDAPPYLLLIENGDLVVLRRDENGAFVEHGRFDGPNTVTGFTLGDLSGDGLLDAVVASSTADTVSLLAGNGDGTFDAHVPLATLNQAYEVDLGDLDDDGDVDLLVQQSYSTGGVLFSSLGDGLGAFAAPTELASSGTGAAVVELPGDDIDDVLFERRDEYVVGLMRGTVTGVGVPESLGIPRSNVSSAIQLLLGTAPGGGVELVRPNADRTLSRHSYESSSFRAWGAPIAMDSFPNWLSAGDVDGDGAEDLIVGRYDSSAGYSVQVVLAGPGGPVVGAAVAASGSPYLLDANGDAWLDLVLAGVFGSGDLLLATGPGTFAAPVQILLDINGTEPRFADFDGDGLDDALGFSGDDVRLRKNLGGTFDTAVSIQCALSSFIDAIDVFDFDDDGRDDILCATSSAIYLLASDGLGGFLAPVRIGRSSTDLQALGHGDVNEDGRLDLMLTRWDDVLVAYQREEPSYLGDMFDAPVNLTPECPAALGGSKALLRDLDGDGRLDGLAFCPSLHTLTPFVVHADRSLTFGVPYAMPSDDGPVVLDIDVDGTPEIAVAVMRSVALFSR